jgi:hypothetical protein
VDVVEEEDVDQKEDVDEVVDQVAASACAGCTSQKPNRWHLMQVLKYQVLARRYRSPLNHCTSVKGTTRQKTAAQKIRRYEVGMFSCVLSSIQDVSFYT